MCFLSLSCIHHLCRARLFLNSVLFLSSEERPKHLPVARTHGVINEDVEGGVDVGNCLQDPEAGQEEVVMATSVVHFWQKEPGEAEQGDGRNANDEQHRASNQHLGQRQLPGRNRQRRSAPCR